MRQIKEVNHKTLNKLPLTYNNGALLTVERRDIPMTAETQTKIAGCATPQGTERFARRMQELPHIANGHFRQTVDGLILSSLGMGTYIGSIDASDDESSVDAALTSVLSGAINVIDSAINYRYQRSERCIKQALDFMLAQGIQRDELFIASKNGFLTPDAENKDAFPDFFKTTFIDSGRIEPQDVVQGMHCMAPAYLDQQLNQSLSNLGVETLDLMYLHNAAESQLPVVGEDEFWVRLEQAFQFYEKARAQGRIQYYGMATWNCFRVAPDAPDYLNLFDVMRLARTVGGEDHGFRFIQAPFNLAMTEALTFNNHSVPESSGEFVSTLEAAQMLGLGVFTSVPLMQGQLLNHKLPQFDGLTTPAQSCLQFARSTPGIVAPLAGHKQMTHVQDNIGIAKVAPLSFEDLQERLVSAHA